MNTLIASDLRTYTAQQVASLADSDAYAVRSEGERRQNEATKKIARLLKQIDAARRELADGEVILLAAFAELRREAGF